MKYQFGDLNKYSGILELNGIEYLFTSDHGFGKQIWAWKKHDSDFDKAYVYKWDKLPNKAKVLQLFDFNNPLRTVAYQPLLGL